MFEKLCVMLNGRTSFIVDRLFGFYFVGYLTPNPVLYSSISTKSI